VPYFVTGDEVGDPYTKCPGVMYSHLVIVQSEKIRQCYIRDYKELEKIGYSREKYGAPEKKFIALGSPKFDAVVNAKPEDFTLPESWQKLLLKPDGTKKKVILYNTNVTMSLNYGKQFLKKIRFVLQSCSSRDDITLWWRPHPLAQSTYASMSVDFADEYEQIVEDYKHDDRGIYDDTPDLHRAITLSDAYYGDISSLVFLYAVTGKQIMLQNMYYHPENAGLMSLQFDNMYDDEHYFWFTAFSFNALFRMDKQTWTAEYMGSFPEEKAVGFRLFHGIVEHKGKLYFAPGSAANIGVYDLASGSFDAIQLEYTTDALRALPFKFNSIFQYGDKLFFAGHKYPALVSYDTSTGQIKVLDELTKKLIHIKLYPLDLYFFSGIVIEDRLYLPFCCADMIVEFNMHNESYKIHKLKSGCTGFVDVLFAGNWIWLTPFCEEKVIRWDMSDNTIDRYIEPGSNSSIDRDEKFILPPSYSYIVSLEDEVYPFPFSSVTAIKINKTTGEILPAYMFQPECERSESKGSYFITAYTYAATFDNKIYAKTGRSNTLIEYDPKTGSRREEHIAIPKEALAMFKETLSMAIEEYGERKKLAECYFYESFYYDLDLYWSFSTSDKDMFVNCAISSFESTLALFSLAAISALPSASPSPRAVRRPSCRSI
jgi:hypothetical protein